jgi:hypothetical protein
MNSDPSCDPEFQLDFQSGAYRQDLLGHGSVRVNLAVPVAQLDRHRCRSTACPSDRDDDPASDEPDPPHRQTHRGRVP